jgi:hypothetical protein
LGGHQQKKEMFYENITLPISKKDGIISGKEKGSIQSYAAKANIP